MNTSYNISEILEAIDELNNHKKNKKIKEKTVLKLNIYKKKEDIPPNTLKLIEESEKNLKN